MNLTPKVSIIMPVKNAGPYLSECIESIINQSYSQWELLAVNDHSNDQSFKILKEYCNKDNRIKCFENEGNGIIDALRKGFHHSEGNYITRMDADDIMHKEKVSLMVENLLTNPQSLAVGLVEYFSHEQLGNGYKLYADWLNSLTLSKANYAEIYKECTIPSPCWMTDRHSFNVCGGFNVNVYPEDYDLAFRFRKQGLKISPIPNVLHYWRDHENRTSRNSPVYADNRFIPLKVMHFMSQDLDVSKPLVLWGAGKNGKEIAKNLQAKDISFSWLTNNPNKIGKEIYGVNLRDIAKFNNSDQHQIIISISSPNDQSEVNQYVSAYVHHTYFFFS